MTHHGGLSLNIIIWRIGGGAKFPFALGPKNSLGSPVDYNIIIKSAQWFPSRKFVKFQSIRTYYRTKQPF
jgi:hypothetical protein